MPRTGARKSLWSSRIPRLGGICLNVGCIPSKALLHAAAVLREAKESAHRGIEFGQPKVDLDKLRALEGIDSRETRPGDRRPRASSAAFRSCTAAATSKIRKRCASRPAKDRKFIRYEKAIIAVGSKPAMPNAFDLGNKRVMTSTEALELPDIPHDLLVVGGGYIGMELGTVYAALGSNVVVLEALPSILAGVDPDLARPVMRAAQKAFKEIRVNTKVQKMATAGKQIKVTMEIDKQPREELYDRVLVSVGRAPNLADLGLENTKVTKDDKGFHPVQRPAADRRPEYLRHRRRERRRPARAPRVQGGAYRRRSDARRSTAPSKT